jgi:hypothetical protein
LFERFQCILAWACGEAEHWGEEHMTEETAHLRVTGKQGETREEKSWSQYLLIGDNDLASFF